MKMKCRKAEKLISRLIDGRLDPGSSAGLEAHLEVCPSCARLLADYRQIQSLMAEIRTEAKPLPYFVERLEAKLSTGPRSSFWAMVERWYAAAVPVFLVIAMVFVGTLFLVQPSEKQLSQSEMLLFQTQSPLKETQAIFEEDKPENRQIKLLFAGLENREIIRSDKQ
jgi:anti-sigma factor RsiW